MASITIPQSSIQRTTALVSSHTRRHSLHCAARPLGIPALPPLSARGVRRQQAPSLAVICHATPASRSSDAEEVYFDGGPHYGDLIVNLALGITGVWMPLTLAAIFRCLFLRYRFTNKRFTLLSGLSDSERRDFDYSVITDVKYAPRFIGEWGDLVFTLKDKTVVEFKSIPCYKEVAAFCEQQQAAATAASRTTKSAVESVAPTGFFKSE